MTVTTKDIADALGLSQTTVSHVLANRPYARVASDTRDKVLSAAKAMGYSPNQNARVLRTGRSRLIGIVRENDHTEVEQRLVDKIEYLLQRLGYRAAILQVSPGTSPGNVLDSFVGSRVEGIVTIVGNIWGDRYNQLVGDIPAVSTRPMEDINGDRVLVDRESGSYTATKHLLDLGHRRIAITRGELLEFYTKSRFDGYCRALNEAGIEVDPMLVFDTAFDLASGYECGLDLARRNSGATGVVCFSDIDAIGTMKGLTDSGLRIPQDISVVGFDDLEVAAYLTVPLTTIAWPVQETADRIIECLMDRINDPDRQLPHRVINIQTELVARESTAPLEPDWKGSGR